MNLEAFLPKAYSDDADKQLLLDTNQTARQYGLQLSEQQAGELVHAESVLCQEGERIRLWGSAAALLAEAFCRSSYLSQQEYASTLLQLLDIFYTAKEESLELIGDEELVQLLFAWFEHRCGGSLELLQSRELEHFYRQVHDRVAGGMGADRDA